MDPSLIHFYTSISHKEFSSSWTDYVKRIENDLKYSTFERPAALCLNAKGSSLYNKIINY